MAANLFDKLSPKAAFLSTVLANAGFNVEELVAKADANAVKLHIEGLSKGQSKEELTTAIATATSELQTQVSTLEQSLSAATAKATNFAALTSSLDAAGFKVTDFEAGKVKAALELHTATAARNMVARAGHPGLLDDPALDPTKQTRVDPAKVKTETTLTGRERMAAAFNADPNLRRPARPSRN